MERLQFYNTTFGSVFDLAFDILRRCWGRFLLCAVWPASVLTALLTAFIIIMVKWTDRMTPSRGNEMEAVSAAFAILGMFMILYVLSLFMILLVHGACLFVIQQAVRGRQLSSRQAYKMAFKRFGTVVWTMFLSSFWPVYWGLSVLPAAAILDDLVTSDAMNRVGYLYKGYRKRTLSILLVAMILLQAIGQLVSNVTQVAMDDQIWAAILIVVYVIQVIITFMMMVSILPLIMASWYYSLRAIKDGYDIDYRLTQLEHARGLAA